MFKKTLVSVAAVFLLCGCQNVQTADQPLVTADAAKLLSEKTIQLALSVPFNRVAVLWFTDRKGAGVTYGRMLADRVQIYLRKSPSVTVADYPVNEGYSKWSSPLEIERAGRALDADAVLEGDILQMKEYNDINARLFDSRNGKLILEIRVRESIEDFRMNGPE